MEMSYLVTCGDNVKIYDVPSYQLQNIYTPFKGITKLKTVAMSYEGQLLAAAPQTGMIEISTVNDRYEVKKVRYVEHFKCSTAIAFQKTLKTHLAIGTARHEVVIFDIANACVYRQLFSLKRSITHLDFNVNDTHLATGCDNGQLYCFDLISNTKSQPIRLNRSASLSTLKFHTIQNTILGAGDEIGTVVVWDINMKTPKLFIKNAHIAVCADMAFSPVNGMLLTSVGYDSTFNCYDLGTNTKIFSKPLPGPLSSLDIEQSGNTVALASRAGFIYTIDLRNLNNLVSTIKAHSVEVKKVIYKSYLPDSESLLESSPQSFINITETNSENELNRMAKSKYCTSSKLCLHENGNDEISNQASDIFTSDSILEVMGLCEPHYENIGEHITENAIQIKDEIKFEMVVNQLSMKNNTCEADRTENDRDSDIKNRSQFSPPSEGEYNTTINLNPLNACLSSKIVEIKDQIKNVKMNVDEVLERLCSEFLYFKLNMVKQFIVQEQKLDKIREEVLKELINLRYDNVQLRTELAKCANDL